MKAAKHDDIKRVTSSAIIDGDTCQFCREMDRRSWNPGEEPTGEPPYKECDGKHGCRCVWVYTFAEEV